MEGAPPVTLGPILKGSDYWELSPKGWAEIAELSTFGNNERRAKGVGKVGQTSRNSRVVMGEQGNFTKHRRMFYPIRLFTS